MKRVRGFACIGTAIVVFCLLTVRPFWGRMVIEGIQQSDQNHRETEEKKVADVDQWIKDGSATVTRGDDGVLFVISKRYQWCTGQWKNSARDRDDPSLIQDPATCADNALTWMALHYASKQAKVVPGRCAISCSSVSHYRDIKELNAEDIAQARVISSTSHHKLDVRLDQQNGLLIVETSSAQNEMYLNIGTPFGTWRSMREARCAAWRRAPTNTAVHTERFTLKMTFSMRPTQ